MTLLFLNAYDVMELLDIFRTIYITYSSVEELEKIYVNYGGNMIENILEWLKSDLRIELYPSYNKRNEKKIDSIILQILWILLRQRREKIVIFLP